VKLSFREDFFKKITQSLVIEVSCEAGHWAALPPGPDLENKTENIRTAK
jgi:hypothetical protein